MAMRSIVVKKSTPIVVRPSEPVPTSIIELSSFDKGLDEVLLAPTMLLAFQHPVHETVETIKRALSQALVHYYPFAGRIVAAAAAAGDEAAAASRHIHIQCGGGGVVFVAASASCALKQVVFSNDVSSAGARTLLHKLAVHYADGDLVCCDRPLLLMQVTEFSCGGFVLGVTWNHAVADGAGMGQFLQAIGELARGLPSPTVAPVRSLDADSVHPDANNNDSVIPMELIIPHVAPFSHLAYYVDITVPSTLVSRIKAEFFNNNGGQAACTAFDAVSALLWQCHTRATMSESSDPDAPALLVFSANVRKHVAGIKDEAYYGNCITIQIVRAKSCTVARGDIIDLVKLIKHSKEKIRDLQFKKKNNTAQSRRWEAAPPQVPYNQLLISSWRNIGLEEADFGSGRPARVAYCPADHEDQPTVPGFIMLPECQGKAGDTMLSGIVKEKHAQAFLRELASFT